MTTDEDSWKLSKKFSIPVKNICFKDKLNDYPPSPGGYIINLLIAQPMELIGLRCG
jgi:hypothetical protein